MNVLITACCMFFLLVHAVPARAGQANPDELLQRSLVAYNRVSDYRCVFHKKELVRGEVKDVRNIEFKFRKPASYYLKYTEGVQAGLETIYVAGKYDNKLEVHLGRLFGFYRIAIDPHGSQALKKNRHPIMEAGIGQILHLMERDYRNAKNDPDCRITLEGEVLVNGRKTHLIKALFPKGKGYYGRMVSIFIDKQLYLPTKITVYGWDNEFLEEYEYDNVRLNAGLADRDFDVKNPEYHF
jgi:outer membrane lipoprotein-sorting protein